MISSPVPTKTGARDSNSNQLIMCVVSKGRALLMTPNEANNRFAVSWLFIYSSSNLGIREKWIVMDEERDRRGWGKERERVGYRSLETDQIC